MRLDRIIEGSGAVIMKGHGRIEVDAICNDSRKVTRGSLFVAVKGYASDGHSYIATAVGKGARVIVYEDEQMLEQQTCNMDTE